MSLLMCTDAIAADKSRGGDRRVVGNWSSGRLGVGRGGSGLTDSLIVLSQKMLGCPGERERERERRFKREINSKQAWLC